MPTHRFYFPGFATVATLVFLATSTGPALATEKGWYIGFSVGQSELVDRDELGDFCNQIFVVCGDKESDTAFKGIVGYQINNYLGVEGAYFDLGSQSLSTEAPIAADEKPGQRQPRSERSPSTPDPDEDPDEDGNGA